MEFIFEDIEKGFYKAKVSEIKEENGIYGSYIRLIFTIIEEGKLTNYRFSGIVKPTSLRQSKFYRWITNILGQKPDIKISTQDIIGRECFVYLDKKNKYYSVVDVSMNPN